MTKKPYLMQTLRLALRLEQVNGKARHGQDAYTNADANSNSDASLFLSCSHVLVSFV